MTPRDLYTDTSRRHGLSLARPAPEQVDVWPTRQGTSTLLIGLTLTATGDTAYLTQDEAAGLAAELTDLSRLDPAEVDAADAADRTIDARKGK